MSQVVFKAYIVVERAVFLTLTFAPLAAISLVRARHCFTVDKTDLFSI